MNDLPAEWQERLQHIVDDGIEGLPQNKVEEIERLIEEAKKKYPWAFCPREEA